MRPRVCDRTVAKAEDGLLRRDRLIGLLGAGVLMVGLALAGPVLDAPFGAGLAMAANGVGDQNATSHTPNSSSQPAATQATSTATPSGNGNQSDGKHGGEPCSGCVGNADNKTPGVTNNDKNAGYECNRNGGVGQTNPAHS